MRRKNCCLAAIMAAVLVLQTPVAVFAAEGDTAAVETTTVTTETTETTEEGNSIGNVCVTEGKETVDHDISIKNDENINYENYYDSAAGATGEGTVLTVNGNATTETGGSGAYAKNGGEVIVTGDVSSVDGNGAHAKSGGSITVDGNATSINGAAAYAEGNGSNVTIGGNASATSHYGAYAGDGGAVTVSGDVSSTNSTGALANGGGSSITVGGNVSSGVVAQGGATVTVGGDVSSTRDIGAAAYDKGSSVTVNGNVTSKAQIGIGVKAQNGASITVEKNVSSINGVGIGAYNEGSSVTVNGNVTSDNNSGISAQNGSNVTVGGDVTAPNSTAIYMDNSTVSVAGNVSGKYYGAYIEGESRLIVDGSITEIANGDEAAPAVNIDNASTLLVGDSISSGKSNNNNGGSSAININYEASTSKPGTILVLGSMTPDNGSTICLNTHVHKITSEKNEDTGEGELKTKQTGLYETLGDNEEENIETILSVTPNIIVGKLNSNTSTDGDYLWIDCEDKLGGQSASDNDEAVTAADVEDNDNDEADTSDPAYITLYEKILTEKVSYFINQPKGVVFTNISETTYNLGDDLEPFSAIVAGEGSTFTIKAADGYNLDYNAINTYASFTDISFNNDGTITFTVPRGGGLNTLPDALAIILESCDSSVNVVSATETEDSIVVVVSDTSFAALQDKVQDDIKAIPANGTLEVSRNSIVSFNKKSFEAIAARPDVSVTVTYVFNGKKYKTVIPAGYPVLDLLDENGYCGCLYLNYLFGSELIEE